MQHGHNFKLNPWTGCEFVPIPKFHIFSYNELKAATQGFRYKIGEGGHGSVYKVIVWLWHTLMRK